jgi:hypothetical protein
VGDIVWNFFFPSSLSAFSFFFFFASFFHSSFNFLLISSPLSLPVSFVVLLFREIGRGDDGDMGSGQERERWQHGAAAAHLDGG